MNRCRLIDEVSTSKLVWREEKVLTQSVKCNFLVCFEEHFNPQKISQDLGLAFCHGTIEE